MALAGTYGSVYIPGTPTVPITQIRSWALTVAKDNYDASVLGDEWREFIGGLKGWSGTLNGYYNLVADTTGQRLLMNAIVNNLTVVLVLSTKAGGGSFEGTANITQSNVSDPVDNLISIDFSFVGHGSLQVLD